MGPRPTPVTSRKRQKTGDWGSGFLWCSATYEEVDVTDYSAVEDYENDRREIRKEVVSKEAAIKKIMEDEEKLTGARRSFDAAKRKAEKEYAEMERKASQAASRAGQEQEDLIAASVRRLSRETTVKLEDTIKFLKNYVTHTVPTVFLEQANLLANCIREELMEPVHAKRNQLQEVQDLLHQGTAEIATRKAKLYDAQQQIAELQAHTQSILTA
jgi:chromosome segregation ATPase